MPDFIFQNILIVGTGSEVTPVVNIDGTIINHGRPGQVTRFIQGRFFKQACKAIPGQERFDFSG